MGVRVKGSCPCGNVGRFLKFCPVNRNEATAPEMTDNRRRPIRVKYNEVFSPDAFVGGEDDQGCGGDRGDGVKPRVLWRLVYLVPVVAGCDCSWRWRSGVQAASCSAGVRIPMAE